MKKKIVINEYGHAVETDVVEYPNINKSSINVDVEDIIDIIDEKLKETVDKLNIAKARYQHCQNYSCLEAYSEIKGYYNALSDLLEEIINYG